MESFNIPLPVKPHDTREGIFKRKFNCRVKYIDTKTVEEIQAYGIPSTGDRARDRDQMEILVERPLSIDEMLDFYRRGQYLAVINYADTAIIYELISDHLNKWKQEIENAYDANYAPIKDLIDLDRFAHITYDKAKYIFNDQFIESQTKRGFASLFAGVGLGHIGMSSTNFVERLKAKKEDPHSHIPARKSMAEMFAARVDVSNLDADHGIDLSSIQFDDTKHWSDE